jgi:PAS domain-containing protein
MDNTLLWQRPDVAAYSLLLADSFLRWKKEPLLPNIARESLAQALYCAPFALVSHDTQDDPVFRYANQTALRLFGMTWDEFTEMPSRLSAEPMVAEERQRLLDEAKRKGYVDTYEGVRIAKDGTRFLIRDTVLWNVTDQTATSHGQACVIRKWTLIAAPASST